MNTIISFALCPFVQRSIITMNYKNVPYEVKYIDLDNKPNWFLEMSPLGKVPVLKVDNEILFESAVINEYIDEISEGSLLPTAPLQKAKDRAYIELGSAALVNYYQTAAAKNIDDYEKHKVSLEKNLTSILNQHQGPYFRGEQLSLIDTSIIPLLQRINLTKNLQADLNLSDEHHMKLNQWLETALSLPAVKNSVLESFESDYDQYLIKHESYIHNR